MTNVENKKLLNKSGLKNTKQRNLILDVLKQNKSPITTEQIYLMLKDVDSSINLSTVYRILDVFVSKGVALKSHIAEDNKAMFELNEMEHKHHLICVRCKKITAVKDCPLDHYERSLEQKTNFEIISHKLEILGYCPKCK